MKILQLIGLLFLACCGNRSYEPQTEVKHILPDTSRSWSGQMTSEAFHHTRKLEGKLNLGSLTNGIKGEELRVWELSGFYDPQRLTILSKAAGKGWNVRRISFHHMNKDSISSDVTRPIENFSSGSYWTLASQSDMANGDDYGCMDGGDVFIEIANAARYRFMWYRCPDINERNDSTFYKVMALKRNISGLIKEQ